MTTNSRPEWAEVSRSALSLELWAIGQEYLDEAVLWHDQPGVHAVYRAARQLDGLSLIVTASTEGADPVLVARVAGAYLTAARMMLPRIQRTRELHTIGGAR